MCGPGGPQRVYDRCLGGLVLEAVTLREIQRIFLVTDALGIHRELIVIPLGTRHPGRVRRMPNGKIEIVVERDGDFEEWAQSLGAQLAPLLP